jgi:hypothetical protein
LEWHPFNKENVRGAPEQYGIYVFRIARGERFRRLKGESDIMYIGSAEGNRGVRGRLQQYLRPGPTQWTNKRINTMAKKYNMDIAWCLCEEASNLELQLLRRYLEDHDELPPLNHASRVLQRKFLAGTLELKGTLTLEHKDKDGNLMKRIEN